MKAIKTRVGIPFTNYTFIHSTTAYIEPLLRPETGVIDNDDFEAKKKQTIIRRTTCSSATRPKRIGWWKGSYNILSEKLIM